MTIVAIHQPNFFPWLGFFDKVARSDVFILLDNVQYQKTGGTYGNRVQIAINGQVHYMTMPIVKSYHGTLLIRQILINNSTPWRKKMLRTLQASYGKCSFYKEVYPVIENLINVKNDNLADFNSHSILELLKLLAIDPSKIIIGSTLEVEGHGTELLVSMVKAVEGNAYLCGGAANQYQNDELFELAGITLIFQNFQHPIYPQKNVKEFVPGLSIIDALMNVGIDGVREILKGGLRTT